MLFRGRPKPSLLSTCLQPGQQSEQCILHPFAEHLRGPELISFDRCVSRSAATRNLTCDQPLSGRGPYTALRLYALYTEPKIICETCTNWRAEISGSLCVENILDSQRIKSYYYVYFLPYTVIKTTKIG